MPKIYAVTSGCYSDYRIDRLFSTKKLATLWKGNKKDYDDSDYYAIEEYEIDDMSESEDNFLTGYAVSFSFKNTHDPKAHPIYGNEKYKEMILYFHHVYDPSLEVRVQTLDVTQALKTASEIKARLIALSGLNGLKEYGAYNIDYHSLKATKL